MPELFLTAKKRERCPACGGSGVLAYEGDTCRAGVVCELICKRCDGNGKITTKVDVTLESLKELLK